MHPPSTIISEKTLLSLLNKRWKAVSREWTYAQIKEGFEDLIRECAKTPSTTTRVWSAVLNPECKLFVSIEEAGEPRTFPTSNENNDPNASVALDGEEDEEEEEDTDVTPDDLDPPPDDD